MKGLRNLWKKIAVVLCAALLLPSVMPILSCFNELTTVKAATDTNKGELPGDDEKEDSGKKDENTSGNTSDTTPKPQPDVQENVNLLPDPKLPTMEVGIMSTPAYVRFLENRECISADEYTVVSSDNSVCTAKKDGTYWDIKGLKNGTTTIKILQNVNGSEVEYATYRVNVMPMDVLKSFALEDEEEKLKDGPIVISMGEVSIYQFVHMAVQDSTQYIFECSDGKIVDGKAIKPGKTSVTIKKIKDGRIQVLGTVECEIKDVELEKIVKCCVGGTIGGYSVLHYQNWEATYTFVAEGDCISVNPNDGNLSLTGIKAGNTKLRVLEKYEGIEREIGVVDVEVVEGVIELTQEKITANQLGYYDIRECIMTNIQNPKIICKIADPTVAKISHFDNLIVPLKVGTTDISVYYLVGTEERELGTVTVSFAKTTTKKETCSVGINRLTDGRTFVINDIPEAQYYMLEKGSQKLQRGRYITSKKGTKKVAVYEKYKDLIVPVGTVNVKAKEMAANDDSSGETSMGRNLKTFEMGLYDTTHISNVAIYDPNAKYSYKIGNKKIIQVENDIIKPKKKGKTTITITKTKDGVKEVVNKVTIKVVNKDTVLEFDSITFMPTESVKYPISLFLRFYKPKAAYTCKISDKNVVTYSKKNKTFNMKANGTADVTIYEKYNGKTRKIGTVKLTVGKQ